MKLSRLFVIAMLVGTVGAFGCSDDETGDGGTGGTAGTGGGAGGTGGTAGTGGGTGGTGGSTDACVGPLCDASEPKAACNAMIEECNATAEADLTPEQCDEVGNAVFCTEGAGGAGGNGGTAGGGGTGGDLGCDVLACETDTALKEQCEDAVQWCFGYCETEECQEDECLALGLLICNVQEG